LKEESLSKKNTAMLQIDFAENYSTLWQDEIQSAHWKKSQITLMTVAYWSNQKLISAVVVSDDLNHKKDSIVTFIDRLIGELVSTDVCLLHIWSDGPSSQFKNRYIAAAILFLQGRHSLDIQWHFFATSHGKGCVDGIGGLVKRKVTERVIQRRAIVKDSESFFQSCQALDLSVKFYSINSAEIQDFVQNEIGDGTFNDAPELKGIKSSHHLYSNDGQCILMKKYSSESTFTANKIIAGPQKEMCNNEPCCSKSLPQINVNDCVKILSEPYKGYFAIVTSQSYGDEWEVQYFKKSFDKYILKERDFDSREPDELIKVDPTVDQRGRYTFSE